MRSGNWVREPAAPFSRPLKAGLKSLGGLRLLMEVDSLEEARATWVSGCYGAASCLLTK